MAGVALGGAELTGGAGDRDRFSRRGRFPRRASNQSRPRSSLRPLHAGRDQRHAPRRTCSTGARRPAAFSRSPVCPGRRRRWSWKYLSASLSRLRRSPRPCLWPRRMFLPPGSRRRSRGRSTTRHQSLLSAAGPFRRRPMRAASSLMRRTGRQSGRAQFAGGCSEAEQRHP